MRVRVVMTDDMEPNSMAAIPGMGIPEQLKIAMEQEQTRKFSLWNMSSVCIQQSKANN